MNVLTQEIMGYITVFENVTGANVKDLIKDSELLFIVKKGDLFRAIGKKGANIKRLGNMLKKKIRVVEFSENPEKFVKNLIRPLEGKVYKESENIFIEACSNQEKAKLIGRNRQNLKKLNSIVRKYFDVEVIIK